MAQSVCLWTLLFYYNNAATSCQQPTYQGPYQISTDEKNILTFALMEKLNEFPLIGRNQNFSSKKQQLITQTFSRKLRFRSLTARQRHQSRQVSKYQNICSDDKN
ncbi:hypothetical protein AVEN_220320-1 [Araneus ventricosus]|uniref:Uncharacterized protein n=1 Tax=Araneus ventricosus TaxID=182803 RepID=A0A4Y2TV70_ARAVE|nr:hypothetical protein AVEN_220320-1 [Araneus ventricosus]